MNQNPTTVYQFPIVKTQYNGCFLDVIYVALVLFSITLLCMYAGEWFLGNSPSPLYFVGIIMGVIPFYLGRKYTTHYTKVPLNFLQLSESHIIIKQRGVSLEVPLTEAKNLHIYYNGLSRKNTPSRIEWEYNSQDYSYMIPIEDENDGKNLYNTLKAWYQKEIGIKEHTNGEVSYLFQTKKG